MDSSLLEPSEFAWVFSCVGLRVLPLLLMLPGAFSAAVPMRLRIALAVCVSACLTPNACQYVEELHGSAGMPHSNAEWIAGMGGELILGLLLASVFSLTLVSLRIAGQMISQLSGFSFAETQDPDAAQRMPLLSGLLGWLAIVVLLLSGVHRQVLAACFESLASYPVGSVRFEASWLAEFNRVLQHTFEVGLRVSVPIGLSLLVVTIANGILSRAVPQLHMLGVGLNLNALAMLVALFLSVGGVGWVFQQELGGWLDSCQRIVALDP